MPRKPAVAAEMPRSTEYRSTGGGSLALARTGRTVAAEMPRSTVAALFLLRTAVLYFLLVNAFLQLRDEVDLVFQSAAFLTAVLAALWMERARLRFLPSLLIAAALPVALRALFFLVFRMQRSIASAPATDFLFLYFDKDFFPALAAYAIAWLFTFLALRRPGFVFLETALNSLLLLLVFWTQAGYHLTLYPHPSIFAWVLALFIVAEFFVLLLAAARGTVRGWRAESPERIDARAVLSFTWILVPLLLVFLLFLLNRYGEGAVKAGGGLMKPTMFRFDFAPYVRLESEIRQSKEAVLLFRTEGKAEKFLLRRFVLSGYEPNQGFYMERGKGIDEPPSVVPDSPESFPDPGYRERAMVRQEYYFLTLDPSSLIALNYPLRVVPLQMWKAASFLRVYRVDSQSMRSAAGPRKVAAPPSMPRDLLSFYTSGGADEAVHALALQVTKDETSYYGKAKAIEEYLQSHYLYSLKPGIAEDGNQLHHFLFVSKKGYCSYFAFAMALMCRSLGIPARVSVGFSVDPQSEILNFYEVRAFQAHAWVEVYFGKLGWVEFDPTSSTPAPGEELLAFPAPDRERMAKLIAEILNNQTDRAERAPRAPGLVGTASRLGREIARVVLLAARLWYITLPALYALLLFAVKILPSLPGLLSRDPRRRVKASYRLSLVRLTGVGMARRTVESPLEHAARVCALRGIALAPFSDVYLKASFGDRFDAGDTAAAREARRGFARSFRARVPWPRRLLGVVNPVVRGP
jgi:transglutaminase-like putative cysteine protease